MTRSLVAAAVVSLFAFPVVAAIVTVDPPRPSSNTPVTVRVQDSGRCPTSQIARSGNTFNVTFSPGICMTPPVLATFRFPVGQLDPGEYEVIVNPPGRSGYAQFVVWDAGAGLFGGDSLIGPTTGGNEVTLLGADTTFACFGPDANVCPRPTVTFNGAPATIDQERFAHGSLAVVTPPNTKGLADVVVTGIRGTVRGRIFEYYDPNEAPPSTIFERVLVPIWSFGPGAYGSKWATEVTLVNNGFFAVDPFRGLPSRLPSRMSGKLDFGASRPGGVLFFPQRNFSSDFYINFGSIVRDTSREDDDWGTEVRVVRESDLRQFIELLNVPVDSRFRRTLRVYDADSVEGSCSVFAYSMSTGALLAESTVELHSANPCRRFFPCVSDDPATAVIDLSSLFPSLGGTDRIRIEIFPAGMTNDGWLYEPHIWAFISVTNNDTQHVTVISPQ